MAADNQEALFPFCVIHSYRLHGYPITVHARPTLLALLMLS